MRTGRSALSQSSWSRPFHSFYVSISFLVSRTRGTRVLRRENDSGKQKMTSTDWLHCQKSEERKPRVATRPFKGRDNRLSQGSERVTQRNQFSTNSGGLWPGDKIKTELVARGIPYPRRGKPSQVAALRCRPARKEMQGGEKREWGGGRERVGRGLPQPSYLFVRGLAVRETHK